MDFKLAFWQIELDETSRYLTVFQANDKLLRYKRLTMGLKPSQRELNVALKSIYAHISNVHLIHDDIIIATKNMSDHIKVLRKVVEAVSLSGLTPKSRQMSFWKQRN